MTEEKKEIKFNIYNPVITYDHRDAYDQIVSQLQEIFPICNQGKCKALEVSDDPQKQKQINDLMEKVEFFSKSLIEITKKFFDLLYRAKEDSAHGITRSTSKIKINMIERNLLERTCDVRWWALEKTFWETITKANSNTERVVKLHQDLSKVFEDTSDWGDSLDAKLLNSIKHVEKLLKGKANVLVNPPIQQEFKKHVDRLIAHFTKQNEKGSVKALESLNATLEEINASVKEACIRLEDIRSSYTLYRDLVIVDNEGIVIANSNVERRDVVLGLDVSDEKWFGMGKETQDGTEYRVQDVDNSKVESEESLVYTTALRSEGSEKGDIVGVMGVFFDFQGESEMILNEYLPRLEDQPDAIQEGWYSFFTGSDGRVIYSSNAEAMPIGSFPDIPRLHYAIPKAGGEHLSYSIFRGTKALIVSHRTEGFDDYEGLGWVSHFILPQETMFERIDNSGDDSGISSQELMSSSLIPEINKQTYKEIQRNKGDIQLISINGIVLATDLGKAGASFIPIFDQITTTGNSTTGKMEELLAEMSSDMLTQNLKALENFSKQAIDLIDRNLFERAADVRWWATDHFFWEALQENTDHHFQEASKRLGIINASYTMYRDLVLADMSGNIVANSKTENRDKMSRINVSDQNWYRQGTQITSSVGYGIQDVSNTELETEETSLIYCGGVIENGQREGKVIGVLGILFDWEENAVPMLQDCLPKNKGEVIEGCAAFYVNKDGAVIATTDPEHFPVGDVIDLPKKNKTLENGDSASGMFTYKGIRYIIGSSKTQGYREYEGLEWVAHVVRPMGMKDEEE